MPAFFILVFSLRGIFWFQTRQYFFVKKPYDIALPDKLESLMFELRSGGIHARTSVGYSEAASNAERADDGTVLGWPIPPEIFANRYAPLLLSAKPKSWSLFWLSFRKSITRPVYVDLPDNNLNSETAAHPSSTEENIENVEYDESPCFNTLPQYDWLVEGTLQEFQRGLDAFLSERISPHLQNLYRRALMIGRQELRKGSQPGVIAHAKSEIQNEIAILIPDQKRRPSGFSKSSLANLLKGTHGTTDIRHYFMDARQANHDQA